MKKATLAVVGHAGPEGSGDAMSNAHGLVALSALGQPTRIEIFRTLLKAEPEGLAAGAIAEAIGCPHNTLSTHLGILARAGLVNAARAGRSIIYRANVDGIRLLIGFLVNDCCNGHPELCDLQAAMQRSSCACASGEEGR
ncbi:helix-turn-helix transcriptional regulator [Rhizobium sp. P32RR-XVIII]|uniref:ArsR/SmtB family transcription factor n=1 Tax=Rhizobium sp. P32RR-XVIII TaxID=2726738 RepID=UPI00145642DE|nr:helix-turn-helix transcriptional regulator [Rhizobium sp. P32RR-XVIII]NLS07899.1 helix-turn-helix transcriptional regulator [Rhizobium sp. P32RR-XVIII]